MHSLFERSTLQIPNLCIKKDSTRDICGKFIQRLPISLSLAYACNRHYCPFQSCSMHGTSKIFAASHQPTVLSNAIVLFIAHGFPLALTSLCRIPLFPFHLFLPTIFIILKELDHIYVRQRPRNKNDSRSVSDDQGQNLPHEMVEWLFWPFVFGCHTPAMHARLQLSIIIAGELFEQSQNAHRFVPVLSLESPPYIFSCVHKCDAVRYLVLATRYISVLLCPALLTLPYGCLIAFPTDLPLTLSCFIVPRFLYVSWCYQWTHDNENRLDLAHYWPASLQMIVNQWLWCTWTWLWPCCRVFRSRLLSKIKRYGISDLIDTG